MKIFKRILIVVAVLIALPFVMALFTKSEYTVERSIVVNKPRQEVFNYVKLLRNGERYNKWMKMDPNMKKQFTGEDGTLGFVYAWEGNDKAGAGEQEIKTIIEGQRVNSEIRFKRPFEGVATTFVTTDSVSATQTKVTWGVAGKQKYPLNLMNLFIEKGLGDDMSESLGVLKADVEKQ
ncbi:MAG TPA: SRPBCC family protein [Cytophagaceae bacterium]|nr:SRPBCC family protein [Cytophagaceae bacterium]